MTTTVEQLFFRKTLSESNCIDSTDIALPAQKFAKRDSFDQSLSSEALRALSVLSFFNGP